MSKKIYVGISRDHSGSMSHMTSAAMNDYNETIAEIRKQAEVHDIDTVVSVVRCGSGPLDGVERESTVSSISVLKQLTSYSARGGGTPLFDSVGELIEQFKSLPDANDPDVQFVIMAITDGGENSSRKWSQLKLAREISELQKTDRWSITFRVPRGYRARLARDLGLYEDNVLEWETSSRGMTQSTTTTREAFTKYYSDAKAGVKSTKKFFTDLKDVSVAEVKANLVDISAQVNLWTVQESAGAVIRDFCQTKSGRPFLKGAAFYQLTKTEDEVQDYKQIAIRDKTGGQVYSGPAARQMLGLPSSGTVRVAPGDHGQFDIYIQSTSVNRKLPNGTNVLYWSNVGTAYKEGASAPSNVQATLPAKQMQKPALKPIPSPKPSKPSTTITAATAQALTGKFAIYTEGYKAGRGKKKNLKDTYGDINERALYVEGFNDGKAKKPAKY